VLDRRLLNRDGDGGESSSDLTNLFVTPECSKRVGYRFVQARGGHLNGVLDSVQIHYRYPAGP
jgi:hypothetical protein